MTTTQALLFALLGAVLAGGVFLAWYVSERQSGYTMKVRASEGPFEGWYLGRVDGALVLVKDRGSAATLEMLETTTEIKGK